MEGKQYAIACYEFIGEDVNELSFGEDSLLEIISQVDSGWVRGQIVVDESSSERTGNEGWFPVEFVGLCTVQEAKEVLMRCSKQKPKVNEKSRVTMKLPPVPKPPSASPTKSKTASARQVRDPTVKKAMPALPPSNLLSTQRSLPQQPQQPQRQNQGKQQQRALPQHGPSRHAKPSLEIKQAEMDDSDFLKMQMKNFYDHRRSVVAFMHPFISDQQKTPSQKDLLVRGVLGHTTDTINGWNEPNKDVEVNGNKGKPDNESSTSTFEDNIHPDSNSFSSWISSDDMKQATKQNIFRDLKIQMEVLLTKKRAARDNVKLVAPVGVLVSAQKLDVVRNTSAEACDQALSSIQHFFVGFCTDKLPAVVDYLCSVSDKCRVVAAKKRDIEGGDLIQAPVVLKFPPEIEASCVEEMKLESSSLYFVLCTLYRCLVNVCHLECSNPAAFDQLARLDSKTKDVLFDKISLFHAPLIRRKAFECLSLLSFFDLDSFVKHMSIRLLNCKSDDQFRDFIPYFQLFPFLNFSLTNSVLIESTLSFIENLSNSLECISRSQTLVILFSSLCILFRRILNLDCELKGFVINDSWEAYNRIFAAAAKLGRKSSFKVREKALELCLVMVQWNNHFILTKGEELTQLFLFGVRDQKVRPKCLYFIKQYFGSFDVNSSVSQLPEAFLKHMTMILPAILPKKADFKKMELCEEEPQMITSILVTIGQIDFILVEQPYIQYILKSSDFSNEIKGIIFEVLHTLLSNYPEHFEPHKQVVSGLLESCFINFSGDSSGKHLLKCFPDLCPPSMEKQTAVRIIKQFIEHPDPEIANAGLEATLRYLKIDPCARVLRITSLAMERITSDPYADSGRILVNLHNLCSIVDFFRTFLDASGSTDGLDIDSWLHLTKSLDGMCLMLLLNTEPLVWTKTTYLIDTLKRITTSQLGDTKKHDLFFEKIELKNSQYPPGWFPPLTKILMEETPSIVDALDWVWCEIFNNWSSGRIGWQNHLVFMMMTVRKTPDKDSLYSMFLNSLVSKYIFASEDVQCVINSHLADMNNSCLECLVDNLLAEREKQFTRDLKKKKKEDLFLLESTIVFIGRLLDNLPCVVFDTFNSEFRSALRDTTSLWICNPQVISGFHVTIRSFAASFVQNIVAIEATTRYPSDMHSIFKSVYSQQIFNFFISCLRGDQSSSKDISKSSIFECKVISAVNDLIQLANFEAHFLNQVVLPFLLKSLNECGPHLIEVVNVSLCNFLKRSPSYLDNFVERSFDYSLENTQEQASFCTAVTKNFILHFESWICICSVGKMVAFALMHMCSTLAENRQMAVELVTSLHGKKVDNISLANSIRLPPASDVHVKQVKMAERYSESMANEFPSFSADIVQEIEKYVLFFDETLQAFVLKTLSFWIGNFGRLHADSSEFISCRRILLSLFSLTKKLRTSLGLHSVLELLWVQTLTSSKIEEVKVVVRFILDQCRNVSASEDKAEVFLTCKMITIFLCRSKSVDLVLDYLVTFLMNYGDIGLDANKFVKRVVCGEIESPVGSVEECDIVFEILVDIAYEQKLGLARHFAIILQSCFVQYGCNSKMYSHSEQMINTLLQTVTFVNSPESDSLHERAEILCNRSFLGKIDEIDELVDVLSYISPNVREEWCLISLSWAMNSPAPDLAVSSLKFFSLLNHNFDYDVLMKIFFGIFQSMAFGDNDRVTSFSELLTGLPETVKLDDDCWKVVAKIGLCLLQTSYIEQFRIGFSILRFVLNMSLERSRQLTVSFKRLFQTPEELGLIIFRGLSTEKTWQDSLWLLKQYFLLYADDDSDSNAPLLLLGTIVFSVLVGIGSSLERVISFFDVCNFSKMELFRSVFVGRTMDMSMEDFLEAVYSVFPLVFPSENLFFMAVDYVIVLLRRGIESWKKGLFIVLRLILEKSKFSPSSSQTRDIFDIVLFFCFTTNYEISTAASSIFPYILNRIPSGFFLQRFNFVREPNTDLFPNQDPNLFLGDNMDDCQDNLAISMRKIILEIFGIDENAPLVTSAVVNIQKSYKSRYSRYDDLKKKPLPLPPKNPF